MDFSALTHDDIRHEVNVGRKKTEKLLMKNDAKENKFEKFFFCINETIVTVSQQY